MANKGISGGPARSIKWGGVTFTPTMDGEPEYDLSDRDFEVKKSGNGDIYTESAAVVGYFQHDVVVLPDDYATVIALKDGGSRSGTVTLPDGSVLSLDCIMDGEFKPTNGVATLKLSGTVRVQ